MKTTVSGPYASKNFRHAISPQTRRRFLRNAAIGSAGLALGSSSVLAAPRNKRLPTPNRSGIEHIVLVMMENRSFDHFLGWLPGADGKQSNLSYSDSSGMAHPVFPLAPDYQGCPHPDPDHSYEGGRVEFDG